MTSKYGDLDRPPLHAKALRKALVVPGGLWTTLDVVTSAPSTNAELVERASDHRNDGVILIAEHQTVGRGRLGRMWAAPPQSGLTMSALVRPDDIAVTRWPWIPLLAALSVAATLRHEAEVDATLKWPNDVMIGDRKVAGLLVERVESSRGPAAAVIGIGLNVTLRPDELPVPTATSLAIEGAATTDRSLLARSILRNLERMLTDWYRHGGDAQHGLHTAYVDACRTIGQRIRLTQPDGRSIEGDAVGIDATGRLLLRSKDSEAAFGAGDVVHLRAQP